LGQALDDAGRNLWGTLLAQGVSRYNVSLDILTSGGGISFVVRQAYQQYLGRGADAGAGFFFANLVQGTMSDADVVANLLATPEYGVNSTVKFYDSTADQKWLNQVYNDALGRNVDPSGLQTYILAIRGGARRTDVTKAILNSNEYFTNVVNNLYLTYLNRPADAFGAFGYVQQLNQGVSPSVVQAELIGSTEYFNNHGGIGGGNYAFLVALFNDVVGAPLDEHSRVVWGTLLAAGVSRQDVALGVIQSLDGLNHLVQNAYLTYLHRPADAGAAYWVSQLQSGISNTAFYAQLFGSHEYYQDAQH
jgi:hypothetical protein